MKHFYIYKPTKNLCSFSTEQVRQGFYYIGEFENEKEAYSALTSVYEELKKANENIRHELKIGQPIMDFDIFNNQILCLAFVHELEQNAELEWAFRQREL